MSNSSDLSRRWKDCLEPIRDESIRARFVALFERVALQSRAWIEEGLSRDEFIVVLVSRRLSCMYEMLQGAGYAELAEVTVVSDRALHGGVHLSSAQRVLLVDDAIILGTTLVDLYDSIVTKVGGDHSKVRVLVGCVDKDRHNPDFVAHLGLNDPDADRPMYKSSDTMEQLALDIARCLYRAGRPYFTDFPLVSGLEISSETWERICATDRWYTVDVSAPRNFIVDGTAPQQLEPRAITFIPSKSVELAVRAHGNSEAMRLVERMKVRAYASANSDQDTYIVNIVPIGIPGAAMAGRVEEVLSNVSKEIAADINLEWEDWDLEGQHRLLQMYTSSCVLAEFWNDLQDAGLEPELSSPFLDSAHLSCYFGDRDATAIRTAFDRTVQQYNKVAEDFREAPYRAAPFDPRAGLNSEPEVIRCALTNSGMLKAAVLKGPELTLLQNAVPPAPPELGTCMTIDMVWVHRVLSTFGAIDHQLERPQEEQLRELSYDEYKQYVAAGSYGEIGPRVIKLGLTPTDLTTLIYRAVANPGPWAFEAVGLAIDVGNDLGIVVPSTVSEGPDGAVWRQYRSGEMAYAAAVPHAELFYDNGASAASRMDLLTKALLEERSPSGSLDQSTLDAFLTENTALVQASIGMGEIEESWVGEVLEVGDDGIIARLSNVFQDGVEEVTRFPRGLVASPDDDIELGSTLLWTIYTVQGADGRPDRLSRVRRIESTL